MVAEVNVATGWELLPPIAITADPGELTLYEVGDGVSETTMYLLGAMTLLLIVVTVTLADVVPAASVTMGLTGL